MVERIIAVIRELSQGAVTVVELAERHGVDQKTIRRLIDTLSQELGTVASERGNDGKLHYSLRAGGGARALTEGLDLTHHLALTLAMDEARATSTMPKALAALEDLAAKIERSLAPAQRKKLRSLSRGFFSYGKFKYARDIKDAFWQLLEAIAESRLCRITYRAVGAAKPKRYNVLPLRVMAHDGALYVHALVPSRGTLITLHLHRLEALEVLEEKGTPPKGYDAAENTNTAFGLFAEGEPTRFRLRFTHVLAPYIRERVWHSTQQIRGLPDGGVELSFTCAPSRDLFGWVAAWRQDVTVVEPAFLRDHLRVVGEWFVHSYAEPRSTAKGNDGRAKVPPRKGAARGASPR